MMMRNLPPTSSIEYKTTTTEDWKMSRCHYSKTIRSLLTLLCSIAVTTSSLSIMQQPCTTPVVDIGVNLTNRAFRNHWREVVKRSIDGSVDILILTGTSMKTSRESMEMAQTWLEENRTKNLYFTVGVHPHDAKSFDSVTLETMKDLLQHPLSVAVGECGLDYNRNFSPQQVQIVAFRDQARLACLLQKPMFVHEREAHEDLVKVLDEVQADNSIPPLPPIVVHCFTGTEREAQEYIRRGYYIGFTGTICKNERGAPLRDILPKLPLERIMVETDAPFMGFKKGRRGSEPVDAVDVARKLSETIGAPFDMVCETTRASAQEFFRLGPP